MTRPEGTLIGPVGRQVAANIERLRREQRLSRAALSKRLAESGLTVGETVLDRQSQGRRRVDADDLVAFAAVLGVTPADLLAAPGSTAPDHPVLRAARSLAALAEDLAAAAGDPQATAQIAGNLNRAVRRVQLEAEELIASAAVQTHDRTNTRDRGNA
jgi:transcriptional regulator with XRE-family HTH domain